LLQKELQITSDLGNCIVFQGGRTIHRGGMVETGERWVIQMGFRRRVPSWRGMKQRTKRRIKSMLPVSVVQTIRRIRHGSRAQRPMA
jgi:hypothetical protein